MDEWDDDDWGRDDEFERSRGSKNTKAVWIVLGVAGGGVLMVLICAGVFIAMVVDQMNNGGQAFNNLLQGGAAEMPPVEIVSSEEKHAAVIAAVNAEDPGVDQAAFDAIDRLFREFIEASSNDDSAQMRAKFDPERQLLQSKKSGVITSLSVLEEVSLKLMLTQSVDRLSGFDRHVVLHVDEPVKGREFVAYAYLWFADGSGRTMRWWVVRGGNAWRFFDCEYLDYGKPESVIETICFEHQFDPGVDAYYDGLVEVDEAREHFDDGENEAAFNKMQLAERRRPFHRLADELNLRITEAWVSMSRPMQAIAAARRIGTPDDVPGAYFSLAAAYSELGHQRKALEYAAKYMARVGGGPDVLQIRCDTFSALGREGEALPDAKRWLRYDPDSEEALVHLAFALDGDRQPLLDHLARQDDPVQAAVSLAGRLYYSDAETLRQLAAFVNDRAPEGAAVEYLRGAAAARDEDYATAAGHYKQAFTRATDEETKSQYVYSYLGAMASAGKYVEAYEAVPDADVAIQYFLNNYDEEDFIIDKAERRRLIDAQRARKPDDPWLHYYTGQLLDEEQKYEEAEREYAAGMAATEDEDLLDSLRYERIDSLVDAGRAMEAYEKVGPPEETFQQLANQFRWQNETDILEKLVEKHRQLEPEDKLLDLFAGIVAMQRKDYRAADRLFARGYRALPADDYARYRYRSEWVDNRFKMGRPLSAYGDIKPDEETFPVLASRLSEEKQWDDLTTLIDMHRLQHRGDPAAKTWQLEMQWQREQYAEIILLLTPWEQYAAASNLNRWELDEQVDKVFRSYLKLGRHDDAIRFAAARFEEDGQPEKLIVAHALAGHKKDVQRIMDEQAAFDRTNWFESLYEDDDAGKLLRSTDYLPLRKQYPGRIPYNYGDLQTVLLLDAPRNLEEAGLRALCGPVLGEDVVVTQLPTDDSAASIQSFLVRAGERRFEFAIGTGTFYGGDEENRPVLKDEELTAALDGHRAWLAVTCFQKDWQDESLTVPALRLTSRLLGDDCRVIYFADAGRLALNDAKTSEALGADDPTETLAELGEQTWMYHAAGEAEEAASDSVWGSLRRITAAFEERRPGQEFFVKVNLVAGFARESQWIPIGKIDRRQYGNWDFTGEFTADSRVNPGIRAGEPVMLRQYDIADWRYTTAEGETVRRREASGKTD